MRLTVEDDGVGLPAAADGTPETLVRSNGHLGIRLLRDRVADEGGTVRIANRPSGGTMLDAVVPVAP